jgi:hypothetical protein
VTVIAACDFAEHKTKALPILKARRHVTQSAFIWLVAANWKNGAAGGNALRGAELPSAYLTMRWMIFGSGRNVIAAGRRSPRYFSL